MIRGADEFVCPSRSSYVVNSDWITALLTFHDRFLAALLAELLVRFGEFVGGVIDGHDLEK